MSVTRLDVVLYGRLVGTLTRTGGRMAFAYTDEYAADPTSTPLSLSMRPSTTAYPSRYVEAHLRGLLPDSSEVRRRWATHFGVRDRDTLGLVAAIGADTAGAAMYLSPQEAETAVTDPGALLGPAFLEPVTEHDVAERLRQLRADGAAWLGQDEHWSLAGQQGKFALRATGDESWALTHGHEPTTHILKPGITRIRAQALTEHVSMDAASRLGLSVAHSRYLEFEDQPAIVVTRFDRTRAAGDGTLVRLHQEDAVQALALDPARKYEQDGGPGVQRLSALLRAETDDDSTARFAQAVIVNYLLGAPDAHAKNYSLLLIGRSARLTPLYDLASGLVADDTGRLRYSKGAMSIGGERAFGEVEGTHWRRFAATVGLPVEQVLTWVRTYAAAVPEALAEAIAQIPAHVQGREVLTGQLLPRVAHLAQVTASGLDTTRRTAGRVVHPVRDELAAIGRPTSA